ncbi:MAG: hypothetical protein ABN479_19680 [Billgrantia sp.]
MTDTDLIAALKRKPYDRTCREAARRLEQLLVERQARQPPPKRHP